MSDLQDFDSVKAGLVKIVHIPTPVPSAQPSPQPAPVAAHHPTVPKITIVEMPPIEAPAIHKPSSTYHHKTVGHHQKQPKSHTPSKLFEEKLTTPKSVLKDVNVSMSSTSDHSADTSIEDIISSIVEQSHQLKTSEQFQQVSPQLTEIVKVPKQNSPGAVESQQKPLKSISLKFTNVAPTDLTTTAKPTSKILPNRIYPEDTIPHPKLNIPPTLFDEPKVPHVVVNPTLVTPSSTSILDKPPVLKPVASAIDEDQVNILKNILKYARKIINKDIYN